MKDFITFGAPLIEEEEIAEVVSSMKSGWLGTGPKVKQFEEEFRLYRNAPHSAAFNSCTAALHIALLVAGVGPGDEVITTAMTFCATVNTIIHCGATPVTVDINPLTLNIEAVDIEKKITSKTKAIVPVHFAGRPCNMLEIMSLASRHHLKVIEDCAHAIESTLYGQTLGTFGDFGCFSFYSTKNLCTGEGGMLLAKTEEDINKAKILGLHGMNKDAWKRFSKDGFKHYDVVEAGFKYNMMDIQAAIGIHQLSKIYKFRAIREDIWNTYKNELESLERKGYFYMPFGIPGYVKHAYHLFTIVLTPYSPLSRDELLDKLTEEGIGTGVHYRAIPEHPFYQETFNWKLKDYPNAVEIGRNILSLPISPKMSREDVTRVVDAIYKIYRGDV